MTQAMAFSAFKGPFEARIDSWNNSLQIISEVIDEWIQLQRSNIAICIRYSLLSFFVTRLAVSTAYFRFG